MMGWYGWLNFLILQWFFMRLVKIQDDQETFTYWTIVFGIVPCSGWFGLRYRYVSIRR